MIEIKNFSKSYGGVRVYENFDLSLEEGKITCILGESGSGKTTLLNAVAGLINYEGSITKMKCSYVFQTPRLVPNLTVYGNLKLVCNDEEKIYEILEKVRLKDRDKSYPSQLSGGQAQRVSLARAFLFNSELILMDEPFSSLDLKLKDEMIKLFFEILRGDKRSVLFVTHDIDEAAAVAQRIIVINGGKVCYDRVLKDLPPRADNEMEKLRRVLSDVLRGV